MRTWKEFKFTRELKCLLCSTLPRNQVTTNSSTDILHSPVQTLGDWSHCQNLGCGASLGTKLFSYFNFSLCIVVFLVTIITGLFKGKGASKGMRLQLIIVNRSLELICCMCFVP